MSFQEQPPTGNESERHEVDRDYVREFRSPEATDERRAHITDLISQTTSVHDLLEKLDGYVEHDDTPRASGSGDSSSVYLLHDDGFAWRMSSQVTKMQKQLTEEGGLARVRSSLENAPSFIIEAIQQNDNLLAELYPDQIVN